MMKKGKEEQPGLNCVETESDELIQAQTRTAPLLLS